MGLFFLIQSNPLFYFLMSIDHGIGYGKIRTLLFFIAFLSLLAKIIVQKKIVQRTFHYDNLKPILYIGLLISLSVLVSLIQGNFSFIGFFPVFEFFLTIVIFSFFDLKNFLEKVIKHSWLILLIFLLDIGFWIYAYSNQIQYGPFRALINGVTFNRMLDLFYMPFAIFFIIKSKSIFAKIISIMTISLTLYRSVYLSIIAVLGLLSLIDYRSILKTVSVLFFVFLVVLFLMPNGVFIEIFDAIVARLSALFTGDKTYEWSYSSRLDQIPILLNQLTTSLLSFFVGSGTGLMLNGNPIFNYFSYHLIFLVEYGFLVFLIYLVWIILITFNLFTIYKNSKSLADGLVLMTFTYFVALISVFPYMTYFPIGSVLAFCTIYALQEK